MEDNHRRDIALFRYSLIREAADPELSPTERGALVRRLAAREHVGPTGQRVTVGRSTLDRWIRLWLAGGYDALVPTERARAPQIPPVVIETAERLRREQPARTAAHIVELLAVEEMVVSARTLQRHFVRVGLHRKAPTRRAFGRFEASTINEIWTGDAMHGRFLVAGAHKPVLFAFIDDHSRLIVGWKWTLAEDTLRAGNALREGLTRRGVPTGCYLDNGSPFVSAQFGRALAKMGIRLWHSKPGEPAGRGKIERFFRTVRDQFEVELLTGVETMAELERLFAGWVEQHYHRQIHSETGQTPIERFDAAAANTPPVLPSADAVREAFLWSETRLVTKTATVSLHSNRYEVEAALVGRHVELVFNPFDLTRIDVFYEDRPVGKAIPHVITRHTHPAARPEPEPDRHHHAASG
ncbi:DDE-type integrase/transposase/recombinase, partial [Candidatus Microthrix parvicella]